MDPTAIREQIERILRSQSFASKGQLRKLLEVLFQNMDSQTNLTPDVVIKELWPAETRTKRSADVATEMNRLRHALESYYNGEGKADSVIITLPNRSVTAAVDGTQEKCWIAARRRGVEGPLPGSRVGSRITVKVLGAIGALAGLATVSYVAVTMLAPRDQPKSARPDGTALRIMDAQGKELWSKTFPEGFGPEWYYDEKGFGPRIWFADLEKKGHTSVLFSYLPATGSQPHSSSLICYSDQGKEKWRWTPGRDLPEANGPTTYKTFSLGVLQATEKRLPPIVVLSSADPWGGGP